MFDFDVGKLLIFGIVALAVIPPKDLPRVMRVVGQALGRMRRMAAEFQGQFMDAMREADLDSVKKELDSVKSDFDIAQSVGRRSSTRSSSRRRSTPRSIRRWRFTPSNRTRSKRRKRSASRKSR